MKSLVRKKQDSLPFFTFRKSAALVLVLVLSGCAGDLNQFCRTGPFGQNSIGYLFADTALYSLIVALMISGLFLVFQWKKIKNWRISESPEAPISTSFVLGAVVHLGLLVIPVILLFAFAQCTAAQKSWSIMGWTIGYILGWVIIVIIKRMMMQNYKFK